MGGSVCFVVGSPVLAEALGLGAVLAGVALGLVLVAGLVRIAGWYAGHVLQRDAAAEGLLKPPERGR